ncbi:MAG: ATP-grasp domain-containing protein [Clostridiaceae bacterium]
MKIGVFWRKLRNVEIQQKISTGEVQDDSYHEAYLHYTGLKNAGYDAVLIEWTYDPLATYNQILLENVDLVFNVSSDEEIIFLEAFNIPYTGSHITIVGADKVFRKIIVSYYGVTTPKFVIAKSKDSIPDFDLKYPLFVKPIYGRGSSGIDDSNIIESPEDLPSVVKKITEGIGQPALIEEFIKGRELTVGVIGYKDPEVLPILEIGYKFTKTNTFVHKMMDQEIITCPMVIPSDVEERIKAQALRIYQVLDIRDFGRIDMILDKDNVPYFLEVNTFAGLNMPEENVEKTAHYGYMGYMAKERGYSRAEFLGKIVGSTIERYRQEGMEFL